LLYFTCPRSFLGLTDLVSDDELPIIFTLTKWTDTYNNSFSQQECDQGEIVTWTTIEGAVISPRIAAFTTPIPVVYSAYLRKGKNAAS